MTDYKKLPASMLVKLLSGLRPNARIVMAIQGRRVPLETEIAAASLDHLKYLLWSKTKDGQKNKNRPESTLRALIDTKTEEKNLSFASGEAFMAAREKIVRGINDGDRTG